MKNIPKHIWLQTGGHADESDCLDFLNAVTWCQDKQHEDDLMYISQEAYRKLQAKYDEALGKLETAKEALLDVQNWNEDLELKWEDQGYRAISALDLINI